MRLSNKVLLATALSSGFVALSAMSASADIACSGNVCWHVQERYDYPRAARIVVHPDTWHMTRRYRLREHEGAGYWRGRQWIPMH
jgi:hypothetical protein